MDNYRWNFFNNVIFISTNVRTQLFFDKLCTRKKFLALKRARFFFRNPQIKIHSVVIKQRSLLFRF